MDNSSDDFFKSKHLNKIRKDLQEKIDKIRTVTIPKIMRGLERIKIVRDSEKWKDVKEEVFIKLFSSLHIAGIFYLDGIENGIFLSNNINDEECFYSLKDNVLRINVSIYNIFIGNFKMSYCDVCLFITDLFKKYFKLYNIASSYIF